MTMDPLVFLTAELKSRDLDSRLLIAAHLLKAGFVTIVGQQWGMFANRRYAPKGCYLFKTANSFQARMMEKCAAEGHAIVACDEEALPFAGEGLLDNVDPLALERSDVFLAQSDDHRRILTDRYPALAERIRTGGNPRIDLLEIAKASFAAEAAEIVRNTGPYLLFNTNFALTNSIWGDAEGAISRMLVGSTIDAATQAGQAEIQTRLRYEEQTKAELLALIRWALETLPDHHVVVRPHPAERADGLEAMLPQHKNLKVVAGTNPVPWMLGARIVIHSNSTTGLEAAVLGRPCLNISPPEHDAWARKFLMRDLNYTVAMAEAAKAPVLEYLRTARGPLAATEHVRHGFPPHAARTIADSIIALLLSRGAKPRQLSTFKWRGEERTEPQKAKFTASLEEVQKGIAAIFPTVPGAAAGHVRQLDDSVFLIAP